MLKSLFVSLSLALASSSYAAPHALALDLNHHEYQQLWQQHQSKQHRALKPLSIDPDSQTAIDAGQKLSQWLALINQHRSEKDQIYLTSKKTRHGIPIDKPSIYGPKQISQRLNDIRAKLPKAMNDVLYGTLPISQTLPVKKETFIKWGFNVNRLYETAVRWEAVIKPYIEWYKARKARDVRGYYYLKQDKHLNKTLKQYFSYDDTKKARLKTYLINLCLNQGQSKRSCDQAFNRAANEKHNTLVNYKNKYWQGAKHNWQRFFQIQNPRQDIQWTAANPNTMQVVFKSPNNNRIEKWLKDNIEDEFQYQDWHLAMDFIAGRSDTAYIKFEPNVTPHVTNGNIVVMDANINIDEYEVQWTIRHEYGHILRLPDCYVEFYDEDIGAAVNYQLDVHDLMCSRAGDMNERIYLELKKHYFKNR